MSNSVKIIVAVPSMGEWKSATAMDIINMVALCHQRPLWQGIGSQEVRVSSITGSLLPKLRRNAVLEAKNFEATHVLFIDSDMRFPSDMLHRLIAHNKEIVAVNCPTKTVPISPTARNRSNEKGAGAQLFRPIFTLKDTEPRLQKVDRIGFGVILIKMSVFKRLPEPWFDMVYREAVDAYVGEDWFFCERCEKHKIPLFVDHSVSWEIQHVGNAAFKHTMCTEAYGVDRNTIRKEESTENPDEEKAVCE